MGRLDNKVAVITGAASGIGLAATKRFVAEGAMVLAVDLDAGCMDTALEGLGNSVVGFAADVTQPEQVENAMAAAAERFGGIDALLANAGIWGTVAPTASYPIDVFQRVIDVNLTSVFLSMRFALPHMVERGGGSIVITSSVAGVMGHPLNIPYSASKHGVIGLMRVAAVEYASAGIRVNTVNPAVADTPMAGELECGFAPDNPEAARANLQDAPLIKRYVAPDEVAGLMLYLASDERRFCTGGVYMIDGGSHMC